MSKVTNQPAQLRCQMEDGCRQPVINVDEKGYVYCDRHGKERKSHGHRCRRMRNWEVEVLRDGGTISYEPQSQQENARREITRRTALGQQVWGRQEQERIEREKLELYDSSNKYHDLARELAGLLASIIDSVKEAAPGAWDTVIGEIPTQMEVERAVNKARAMRVLLDGGQAHSKDADCDVDRETGCCRGCGAEHGKPCERCGGRGYHVDGCGEMQS